MNLKPKRIAIAEDIDVAFATMEAGLYAKTIGFKKVTQFMISTAVSELARNIFRYAKTGEIVLNALDREARKGIEVIAEDDGPGIPDIGKAMEEKYSTGGTLGMGLPGTKRLMDEFRIEANHPRGTRVTVRKWVL